MAISCYMLASLITLGTQWCDDQGMNFRSVGFSPKGNLMVNCGKGKFGVDLEIEQENYFKEVHCVRTEE